MSCKGASLFFALSWMLRMPCFHQYFIVIGRKKAADTLLVKSFDMEVLPAADLSKKVERFGKQSEGISLLLHNFFL